MALFDRMGFKIEFMYPTSPSVSEVVQNALNLGKKNILSTILFGKSLSKLMIPMALFEMFFRYFEF